MTTEMTLIQTDSTKCRSCGGGGLENSLRGTQGDLAGQGSLNSPLCRTFGNWMHRRESADVVWLGDQLKK